MGTILDIIPFNRKRIMKIFFSLLAASLFVFSAKAGEYSLRSVCNDTHRKGANTELQKAIDELTGPNFSTAAKRKANSDSYFKAIRNVIQHTSFGASLIGCLEDNSDARFSPNTEFVVMDSLDGLTASFEYIKDQSTKKYTRYIEMVSSESPMAAITFVAHEMKHSCNASKMLTAELNGASRETMDQIVLVDEVKAYKFQSEFFLDLAEQAPGLVCESDPVPSKLFSGRFTMQDLCAEIHDAVNEGTFYKNIIKAYVPVGNFESDASFYQPSDTESASDKKLRSEVIQQFEAEGLKIKEDH
jgi:hypothetical protein